MSGKVTVILGSTVGCAEDVVCFVDADEAIGRGRVVTVVVWVVAFGEQVELTVKIITSTSIECEQ